MDPMGENRSNVILSSHDFQCEHFPINPQGNFERKVQQDREQKRLKQFLENIVSIRTIFFITTGKRWVFRVFLVDGNEQQRQFAGLEGDF